MAASDKTVGAAMPQEATEARQARIIVGLDTSFVAREALSLAARLAASVDARLKGVFVEDENLLTLADLPFAREISFSGETRAMDPARMLRAMKAQAESARRILARAAAEAHVDWSFDVRRGRPLTSLAASAHADDTLVIRSQGAALRDIGRTVRAATREARADVLLVSRGTGLRAALSSPVAVSGTLQTVMPGRPVVSIDEGSSIGESCSAFAETLASRLGAPFRRLLAKGRGPADIAAVARHDGAGLIVVNADWLGDDDDAAHLSAAAGCPVLLLGSERPPRSAPSPDTQGG
ncbi:MAG: universal stress protein [Parvibaculum sp.]